MDDRQLRIAAKRLGEVWLDEMPDDVRKSAGAHKDLAEAVAMDMARVYGAAAMTPLTGGLDDTTRRAINELAAQVHHLRAALRADIRAGVLAAMIKTGRLADDVLAYLVRKVLDVATGGLA
jgi:hypothetical protein